MGWLLLIVAGFVAATLLLALSVLVHPALAVAFPIPIVAGLVIVARPFLGVLAMVLFTQMDAVLDKLTLGLPSMKLLAAGTLVGLVLKLARGPRPADLGLHIPAVKVSVLFLLWLGVSSLFSHDLGATAASLSRLIPLVLLFYFIVMLADNLRKVRLLTLAMLVSTLISGAVTVLDTYMGQPLFSTHDAAVMSQWGGHSRSAGATNSDPTTAAAMLLTGVAQAAVLAVLANRALRYLAVGTVVAGVAGIVFSLARSASLGLGLVAAWLLYRFREPKLIAATIVLSPFALAVFFQLAPDHYVARILTLFGIGGEDFTLYRRMTYHIIGFDLIRQYPIFGIGLGSFPDFYMDFDYRWLEGRTLTPRVLHNMPLSMIVETGLIGGVLFIALILTSIWPAVQRLRRGGCGQVSLYAEASVTATTVLLMMSLTLPLQYNKLVWVLLGLTLAISRIEQAQRPPP
jgi:O-antigen ligase